MMLSLYNSLCKIINKMKKMIDNMWLVLLLFETSSNKIILDIYDM